MIIEIFISISAFKGNVFVYCRVFFIYSLWSKNKLDPVIFGSIFKKSFESVIFLLWFLTNQILFEISLFLVLKIYVFLGYNFVIFGSQSKNLNPITFGS